MAYCVECGSKIESEWKFCSDCSAPVKKAAKAKSTPGATEIQKVADRILDPLSYSHWLAAGKPYVIESYGEVLGFDLKNIDEQFHWNYLAFARHWLGKKNYKPWVHAKYPPLGLWVEENGQIKRPKNSLELNSKDVRRRLGREEIEIWKKAGNPRIFMTPDEASDDMYFLDWFDWFRWKSASEPLEERELLAPFASAEKTLKDEDEIRELLDRDALKVWKKRDRPTLIKSFGTVYYKTQLDFKKLFDIEMPPLLLDIWYLAGCPKLKGWNYIASTEEYLGELEAQQSRGSLWSRFANGVGEFSVGLSQGLGQSGGVNYNPGQPDYNQIWKCVKCGTQLASQFHKCPFCQETSYGFK